MKKIYSLISAITISTLSYAQVGTIENTSDLIPAKKITKNISTKNYQKTATTGIIGRFDPGNACITANGVLPAEIAGGSAGTKVGLFVSPTYCDSTTKSSFASASYISNHKFGMNFDPKSTIFDPVNFNQLLTATDSYYLDTVWVGNFYQRRTNFVDTLQVEIVWGDTVLNATPSNTVNPAFGRFGFAAPNDFLGTFYTPIFTSSSSQGNTSFCSGPASNRLTVKYVLGNVITDTAMTNNTGYIPVAVNGGLGQLIPANNIVTAVATFVPGEPNIPVGNVSYSSSTSTLTATSNGMAARVMVQNAPAAPSAGMAYFDDLGLGKNYTVYSFKRERYNLAGSFAPALRSSPSRAYMMDFSIHTPDVVTSVNTLSNNITVLGQNVPNPFTKESMVKFDLAKDVNSATFTVTDVMGRIISSEKVGTTKGSHSIKLGAYAAGLYYYSLNVDGNVSTKKMIVE
jgi:hypothetical protein